MNELEKKAYIFGTIFTLSNRLQVLGDEFDRDVTIKQWLFLVGVSTFSAPPTISEVANFIGYSRQNAKRIAAVLQKRGYVAIVKDQNDARALRIELTPKCTEHFEKRNQSEIESLEKMFSGFDAELTDGFYRGLARLAENVETMIRSDAIHNEEEQYDDV